MKFVTILGSPKKSGNTAGVLNVFEKDLSRRGHEVERINIAQRHIEGCLGCAACKKDPNAWSCRQKDDFQKVFSSMDSAEGLIYATPLYGWCFPGQMKLFLDRHFCLVKGYGTPLHRSALAGRRSILLVTCAGPEEGNADMIKTVFDRFCLYTAMENRGKFVVSQKSNFAADGLDAAAKAMAETLLA